MGTIFKGRLFAGAATLALSAVCHLTPPAAAAGSCTGAAIVQSCTGPIDWTSGDLAIDAAATVSGPVDGVVVSAASSVGALTNYGILLGMGISGAGIDNSGSIAEIVNAGTISGTGSNANGIDNLGTLGILINTGLIEGTDVNDGVGYGVGIWNAGTIGTLTNYGNIYGSAGSGLVDYGIYNSGHIVTLMNEGYLTGSGSGSGAGIDNNGEIGTLINDRIILGGDGNAADGEYDVGIDNEGTIVTLINTGSISGSGGSNGFGILNKGRIYTLNNSGTISGGQSSDDLGIANYGKIDTLNNTGIIIGSNAAISNSLGAGVSNWGTIGTFYNAGSIAGGASGRGAGIYNGGAISTLTNDGSITGGHGAGIFNGGTIATLTNNGTISGVVDTSSATSNRGAGINNYGGTIATLINNGIITGSQYAIYNAGFIGTIVNTGTIAGHIVSAKQDLTFSGASDGSAGVLTGKTSDELGIITAPNVTFSSGSLLLEDYIVTANLAEPGVGVVTNNANLLLDRSIDIIGNYVQGSAGTLTFVATSSTQYGAMNVAGSVDISDGVIKLVAADGSALHAGTYTLITTSSLSASGVSVKTVLPKTVRIDDTKLVVTLSSWTSAGKTAGGAAVAMGPTLDALATNDSYTTLLTQLSDRTSAQQARALKQLNVSPLSAQTSVAAGDLSPVSAAIDQRLTGELAGSALWGQVLGGYASQNASARSDGYSATTVGLMIGADTLLCNNLVGGLSLGWLRRSANGKADISDHTATIDSYLLNLYGSWRPDGGAMFVEGIFGGAYNQFDQKRVVDFLGVAASADYHGWQYQAKLSAGYDIPLNEVTLTPLAGVLATRIENNAYAETGAGLVNLTVADQGIDTVESELGGKLSTFVDGDWGLFRGMVRASWLHSYANGALDVAASLGGQSFVSRAPRPAADGAHVSAGLTWQRKQALSLSVEYDAILRADSRSHFGMLRLRSAF